VYFTIVLQIFERVFELDAVRFEKTAYFHTSLKSQQAAELGGRELPFAIGLRAIASKAARERS